MLPDSIIDGLAFELVGRALIVLQLSELAHVSLLYLCAECRGTILGDMLDRPQRFVLHHRALGVDCSRCKLVRNIDGIRRRL